MLRRRSLPTQQTLRSLPTQQTSFVTTETTTSRKIRKEVENDVKVKAVATLLSIRAGNGGKKKGRHQVRCRPI